MAGTSATLDPRAVRFGDREQIAHAPAGRLARRPWIVVAALMGVAVAIRLLLVRGIWVDEAISIHQAHMSLPGMLADLRATDNHPPLYFLILWATTRALGYGELAVRLPSIVAGTLLVPSLFLAGRALFDRRTGLLAAALGSVAPLVVWYSQEARMYALVMLFVTLAVWAQARILSDGRPRYWVAYAVFAIALIYTNYFAAIAIAIQQVAFGVAVWRRAHRGEDVRHLVTGIWITWVALVAAIAPLAPFALDQFHHNQAGGFENLPSAGAPGAGAGSGLSVYALISNVVWAIWGYHADSTMLRIAALWPMLMLVALLFLGRGRSPRTGYLVAMAVVPILTLFTIGLLKRELFEVRYFAVAVPMLFLLLARVLNSEAVRKLPLAVATLAVFASLFVGLADQQLSNNNPRDYDFRGAIEKIDAQARPGDTVLFAPSFLRDVVGYYGPRLSLRPLGSPQPNVPGSGHVFLIASFLQDDPSLATEVGSARWNLGHGARRLISTNDDHQIQVWEFG
ncbi:MAG: mannosyltransferase [Solirubrobacterales bacterium]|nr:mannosyltransferase [Solirubrobacterales bacterium]